MTVNDADAWQARRRGLVRAGIAIGILILLLILLAGFAPVTGQRYPAWVRVLVQVLFGGAWLALLSGLYRAVVGTGVGTAAGLFKAVAVTIVVVGALAGAVSVWLLDEVLSAPWSGGDGDDDWD